MGLPEVGKISSTTSAQCLNSAPVLPRFTAVRDRGTSGRDGSPSVIAAPRRGSQLRAGGSVPAVGDESPRRAARERSAPHRGAGAVTQTSTSSRPSPPAIASAASRLNGPITTVIRTRRAGLRRRAGRRTRRSVRQDRGGGRRTVQSGRRARLGDATVGRGARGESSFDTGRQPAPRRGVHRPCDDRAPAGVPAPSAWKSVSAAASRSANRSKAGPGGSGETGTRISAGTPIGTRLVTSTCSPAQVSSNASTATRAAATTSSQLSNTRSVWRSPSHEPRLSSGVRSGSRRTPTRSAMTSSIASSTIPASPTK